MKTLLKNFWLTSMITGVMVIGNWMWCVYVENWNPNNMSLDWIGVIIFAAIIWSMMTISQKGVEKIKAKNRKYIVKTL